VGIWNPPYERLAETCAGQSAAFLRVAALLPRISLQLLKTEATAGHTRIELRVANHGYLASYGVPSAKDMPHCEPLRLRAAGEGLQVLAPSEAVVELGHLAGWGGGLYGNANAFSPWTSGNRHERFVTLLVAGRGRLKVELSSCRVGTQTLEIELG
jgi:hypothetical protein